ncbi:MAG: HTTM domain-containing protein, partial [Polyangiaceae bacterium]
MTPFVRRWVTEEGDTYVASLVRVLIGGLLLYTALRETWRGLQNEHFAYVFHLPLVPESVVPGAGVWWAIVVSQIFLAGLVAIGRFARPALFLSALLGVYVLSCDRLGYHNNRYALCLFAFLLAFAPCDRAFVLRAKGRAPLSAEDRRGPLWAVRLVQLQMSIIYVASGGSKLLDADWRDGLVLGDRLTRATSMAVAKGVPAWLMEFLADPALSSGLAKLAIATELALAVTLF